MSSSNLTTIATTSTASPVTDIQTDDKKNKFISAIKERFISAKNFILTHKSAAAQVAGVAGLTLGAIVLGATSLGTVGISFLVVGGVLLAAGTGGLICKTIKEGKAEEKNAKQIINVILKKTVKHTFIGVAVGCLLSFCTGGTAILPFLSTVKTKGEAAVKMVNIAKETTGRVIETEQEIEARIDKVTDCTQEES